METAIDCYRICPKCGNALFNSEIHKCSNDRQSRLREFFDIDGKEIINER